MSHHFIKTSPTKKKIKRHLGSKHESTGVEQGQHTVVVVAITNAYWSKKELIVGEDIDAIAQTTGMKDGTEVSFVFYEKDTNAPPLILQRLPGKISNNQATLTWKYPEDHKPQNASSNYSVALLFFEVTATNAYMRAGQIPVYSDLNIKVIKADEKETPLKKVRAIIHPSNGNTIEGVTDSSGKITIKKLPPLNHRIKFPDSAGIAPADKVISGINPMPIESVAAAMGSKVHVFKLIDPYVYCTHKIEGQRRSAGNMSVFEVVPDSIGKDAYKDEVKILSLTATSLQFNNVSLKKEANEFGMNAFLLKCDQDFSLVPNIFDLDFWKGLKVPKEYRISGLPAPLTIKCYRPDLYKFQIKFPAFRKWSGGTPLGSDTAQVENDLNQKKPRVIEHQKKPTEKEGWHLNEFPMPLSSKAPITLQRNGTDINSNFMKSVGAFIELANNITGIIAAIQKYSPNAGGYFEWENEILQGTFVVEWGWKEYKDNRAYYYVGANINVKLIEFKMELGYGLSGFTYKIQIYGAINGSITLSVKWSRYSPDGDSGFEFPFDAEIIGSLGGRVELGCFVKLEGTLETGIKLEDGKLKFKQEEGWSIACALKWTGIVGKFIVSGGTAKKKGVEEQSAQAAESDAKKDPELDKHESHTYEHELIGSKDLGKWEWSSTHKAEYNPPIISAKDLHDLMKDTLTDGQKIRVKIGEGFWGNKYKDYDELAKDIEENINKRNDIRMDPKAIEAVIIEIKQTLEATMMRRFHGQIPYLEESQFKSFLNDGDLKSILDKDIDPMREVINKNS